MLYIIALMARMILIVMMVVGYSGSGLSAEYISDNEELKPGTDKSGHDACAGDG